MNRDLQARLSGLLRRPSSGTLLLLLLGVGWVLTLRTNVLLEFPLGNPAWFLWHPLLLPFRPSVRTDAAGWLLTAHWWAWLCAVTAIVASLRRPRWLLLFAALLVAGIPPMGMLLSTWARWGVVAVAALLAWRKLPTWTLLVLSVAVLAPPLAAAAVVTGYGLSVGGSPWLVGTALGIGVLLALWALRSVRDGPVLLPPIALITLTLTALSVSPAARRHHDAPATPADCASLDVKILRSFADTPDAPLWSVADHPQGIAVGGQDHLWALDDDGALLRHERTGCGRPFALATVGNWIIGTFQCGVLGWIPGGGTAPWFQTSGFDEPMHIVTLDQAVLLGSNQYPVAIRTDGSRVDIRYYGDPAGVNLFGIARTRNRVFVWDGSTLAEIDPYSLDPVRVQTFPSPDRTIAISGGGRLLARSRPLSRAVEILDGDTLRTLRTFDLGFSARYLALDPDDRYLAAVDFVSETLVVHNIRDGSLVGRYRVGPRPRGVEWSARRQDFMGVSACGAWGL